MPFLKPMVIFLLLVVSSASYSQNASDVVPTLEQEVQSMKEFIAKEGQWSDLAGNKIHISVYLIQFDKTNVAQALLEQGVIDGFVSFPFEGAFLSDVQVAIVEGKLDYFKALMKRYPEKVNDPIKVSDSGDKVSILGLLSTNRHKEKIYYESLVLAALKAGANPRAEIDKGISPLVMASSFGNDKFIEIVGYYENALPNPQTEEDFFKNPSLTTAELIDEQSVIDAFIELNIEEDGMVYETKVLHDLWIKMITKGYNSMAEVLYNSLKDRDDFTIDMRTERGLSALIASGMSKVYGGNVDYAQTLIKRGADIHQFIQFGDGETSYNTGVIELALPSDNHKFVALMVNKGVNFLHSPQNQDSLIIDMAIKQKAYRSAFVIKASIDEYVARMQG